MCLIWQTRRISVTLWRLERADVAQLARDIFTSK